jgi:hypothetical protein
MANIHFPQMSVTLIAHFVPKATTAYLGLAP